MKVTEFEEMVGNMLEVMERYLPNASNALIESFDDILWNNFEQLITEDDRNYN